MRQNAKTKEQFEMPPKLKKTMDIITDADVDKWLEYLQWVPDFVSNFHIPEKVENGFNDYLNAINGLRCELAELE